MIEIRVTRQIPHPRERVFDVYTDHAGWSDWTLLTVTILRDGDDDPRGVGCVRALPGGYREEITAFEPHREMRYRLFQGFGVSEHEGVVTFTDEAGGTRVEWVVRLTPSIPLTGWIFRAGLGAGFAQVLKRLERRLSAP